MLIDGGATSRGSLTPATGETIDGAASQCASSEDDDYAGNPSVMQSLPHRADAARKSLVQFLNSLKPSSDDLVLLGGDDGFHGCTADGPTTATADSPPPLPVGAGGGRLQSIARNSAAAMAKACARIDTLEHDIMDMQDEILAKSSAFTDMQTHLNTRTGAEGCAVIVRVAVRIATKSVEYILHGQSGVSGVGCCVALRPCRRDDMPYSKRQRNKFLCAVFQHGVEPSNGRLFVVAVFQSVV